MKRIIWGICLLNTIFSQSFGQSIVWNTPVSVADGSTYSNTYPRLTLTTNDIPVVAWGSISDKKVYTSRWSGASFATPVLINPAGVLPSLFSWSGAEIASSGDTAFVVFSTTIPNGATVYTVRSVDGGITFGDTTKVDQIGTDIARFPSIATGFGGNPIVNFMRMNSSGGNAEYDIARSTDGGITYLSSITPSLDAPGEVCDCCPGALVTDGDKHILLYRNNDNNIRDIWASYSVDGSANYTSSSVIDVNSWMLMSCPSTGPSGVIEGDSLFSTWMSDGKIYIGSANIADGQIGVHRQLFEIGTGAENFPIIAGKGDTLAVIWENNDAGTVDILFSYSVTGLSGLGVIVDTLTNTLTGNQTRPDIVFSNGKFHIVYRDANNVMYSTSAFSMASLPDQSVETDLSFFTVQKQGAIDIHIHSSTKSNATIELINVSGQKVLQQKIQLNQENTTFTQAIDNENGIYFLVLRTDNGETISQKILLNK